MKILVQGACLALCCFPSAQAQEWNSAALKSLIESRQITSIEQLLPQLPSVQRSHYALMFNSRSLHEADMQAPRVLMYGKDARFIISFNGEPRQKGFQALETMEYDATTHQFLYREIEFPAPGSQGKASFSAFNPPKCLQCHGTPPRPVWDTFPIWPGAYGEVYNARLSDKEAAGLRSFLAIQPTHPRYSALLDVHKLAEGEIFHQSSRSKYFGEHIESPNDDLGNLLNRMNIDAIVAGMVANKAFPMWMYALLGSVETSCGGLEEYVPPNMQDSIASDFKAFSQQTTAHRLAVADSKRMRSTHGPGDTPAFEIETLDRLRYLSEARLGIRTAIWSTALERDASDFTTRTGARSEIQNLLWHAVGQRDAHVLELSAGQALNHDDRYCQYLRRSSQRQIEKLTGQNLDTANPGSTLTSSTGVSANLGAYGVVSVCRQCHETGVGPYIPYGEPDTLKAMLNRPGYRRGTLLEEIRYRLSPQSGADRMPPTVVLTDEERVMLLKYFSNLATQ